MTSFPVGPFGLLVLFGALLVGSTATERPATPPPAIARADPDRLAVLLIDAQPSFWRIMAGRREPVEARIEQLLLSSRVWGLPLLATFEHDPERNGWLPERLESAFPEEGKRLVKRWFDCCREPAVREALTAMKESGRRQIAVAGAETDVCVLQSVLGLLEMGFEVYVLEDCLFTAEPNDAPALERMRAAGAVITTFKTLYFEIEGGVGGVGARPEWRERWRELRGKLRSPYDLPR